MSHTVHPYAHRLGILRDWKSRWFTNRAKRANYRKMLKADVLLREFIEERLRSYYIDSIEMERGEESLRILIKTSRPGMIIGRSGEGSVKLKDALIKKMNKIGAAIPPSFKVDIEEVRSPESHANIVASMVIEALEKKMSFRRVMKQTLEKVMANKEVKGAKIMLSGRLGGSEMSRTEWIKKGRLPLQTFRADVDYSQKTAFMSPEGSTGVKVWIYKGDVFTDNSKKNK